MFGDMQDGKYVRNEPGDTAMEDISSPAAVGSIQSARIVEAARQLFLTRGYRRVTVGDIGAEVGLTGPALYRHFGAKEALLAAALELSADRAIDDAHRIIDEARSPDNALNRLVRAWARAAVTDQSRLVLGYFRESSHLAVDARVRLTGRYEAYVNELAEVLLAVEPGLSVGEAAIRVRGVLALISSAPSFVTDAHDETVIDMLTNLAMRVLRGS